ncbi:MAG: hypothetical protein EPN86_02930 [Nanoarchaeota archaeon]|nr:MAG: hypothetical protein EPN86_02930 [Nanoarchaeota archaeon]
MKILHIRAIVNGSAALVGISGLALMQVYPGLKEMFLSIEVILLPTLYMISNSYVEELVRTEYAEEIRIIKDAFLENEKLFKH